MDRLISTMPNYSGPFLFLPTLRLCIQCVKKSGRLCMCTGVCLWGGAEKEKEQKGPIGIVGMRIYP